MKKTKTKTKKGIALAQQLVALSLLVFSILMPACKDSDPAPEAGIVEADVPEFALVNVPTTLLDKSNNAASRTWTITGGTPATSTDKSVAVTFTTSGTKSITLDVVFDNGTTNSATFTIDVADELNASIASTETSSFELGDNDVAFSVTFSANAVGDPDGYNWSFPGGTPETSTEESPVVVWLGGGMSEVSLTITRSADGASLEVSETVQVGPENLFNDDVWGFEGEDILSSFQTWDGGGPWAAGVLTQVSTAFDGLKSAEINYDGSVTGYYGMITRDTKVANATEGALKLGDIVLYSFYAKANTAGAVFGFSRIVNHAPSWWEGGPPPGWDGFTAADAQDYQFWTNIEPVELGTDWQRVSVIDTLSNINYPEAINIFPEFGISTEAGIPAVISLDKVELKLIGNVN